MTQRRHYTLTQMKVKMKQITDEYYKACDRINQKFLQKGIKYPHEFSRETLRQYAIEQVFRLKDKDKKLAYWKVRYKFQKKKQVKTK